MRVLLTGAGGFIGSHVARALVTQGDQVTGVLMPGESTARLEEMVQQIALVEADLGSADLDRVVDEAAPDACIHLAWYVEPSRYLTAVPENLASLAAGTRLLSALDKAGVARAVLAGTCLEPGTSIDGEPCHAETIYAAAKAALHEVGAHLDTTSVVCAHVFYLYGPGENDRRVVPAVIRACLEGRPIDVSSGGQRRDFLHVEDVASAIVAVAKSDIRGKVDICSGTVAPLRQVFDAIGDATGHPEMIRMGGRPSAKDEPGEIAGDATILAGIGWKPRWTLDEGVAETVEWWRARLESERTLT